MRATEQTARWTLAHPFAVPGTGKASPYRWLRNPRNIGVKRALLSVVDSLRGVSVPPDDWQDRHRSCERTWKRHRKTRWRDCK